MKCKKWTGMQLTLWAQHLYILNQPAKIFDDYSCSFRWKPRLGLSLHILYGLSRTNKNMKWTINGLQSIHGSFEQTIVSSIIIKVQVYKINCHL